jgi:hypothetical protein
MKKKTKKEIAEVIYEVKELSAEQAKDIYGGISYAYRIVDGVLVLVFVKDNSIQ